MKIPQTYVVPKLCVSYPDNTQKYQLEKALSLEPAGDNQYLFQCRNFEKGFDIQIFSQENEDSIYENCYSVIRKQDKEAIFFHQFSTTDQSDPDESVHQLLMNFKRMKSILEFMHSLTNDQCAQHIKDFQKKYGS